MSVVWLCLVNKKLIFSGDADIVPGVPREPLKPTGPCGPGQPKTQRQQQDTTFINCRDL